MSAGPISEKIGKKIKALRRRHRYAAHHPDPEKAATLLAAVEIEQEELLLEMGALTAALEGQTALLHEEIEAIEKSRGNA